MLNIELLFFTLRIIAVRSILPNCTVVTSRLSVCNAQSCINGKYCILAHVCERKHHACTVMCCVSAILDK